MELVIISYFNYALLTLIFNIFSGYTSGPAKIKEPDLHENGVLMEVFLNLLHGIFIKFQCVGKKTSSVEEDRK